MLVICQDAEFCVHRCPVRALVFLSWVFDAFRERWGPRRLLPRSCLRAFRRLACFLFDYPVAKVFDYFSGEANWKGEPNMTQEFYRGLVKYAAMRIDQISVSESFVENQIEAADCIRLPTQPKPNRFTLSQPRIRHGAPHVHRLVRLAGVGRDAVLKNRLDRLWHVGVGGGDKSVGHGL